MAGISPPTIGENLARIRRRCGLTQEGLAERADVSVSVIRKLERSDRESASLPTLRKLAQALSVTTVELFDPKPLFDGRVDDRERDDLYAIRRILQPPRTVTGEAVITLADDEEPPSLDAVRESVREVNWLFRDSEYANAVAQLPTAIAYARFAAANLSGLDQTAAWGQLTQAYQTAALVLIQLKKYDLAYHTIGLAMDAARRADDEVAAAGVVCTENWLLTEQARLDDAERAALAAAEAIEPSFANSSRLHVGVWGWLNLGVAAAAMRNNRPDAAEDAMRQARAAAQVSAGFEAPDIQHWTYFDPAVAAMRDVELAIVAGDIGKALQHAGGVPARARPLVTYQRFQLDMAAAHLERRRHDKALQNLLRLRAVAPTWLRHQRYAKRLTSRMLHSRPRTIPADLRDLADFLDVTD